MLLTDVCVLIFLSLPVHSAACGVVLHYNCSSLSDHWSNHSIRTDGLRGRERDSTRTDGERERESLCRLQLNNEVLQFLSWTYFVNLEPLYEGVYAGCSWIMKYYSFKYEPILLIWFGVWTFIFVFHCEDKVEDSCSPSPNLKS